MNLQFPRFHRVAISLLVSEANREIKRAESCDHLRWLALWGTRVLFGSVSERAHRAQHVWQGPTQGFKANCFAKYDHLEHCTTNTKETRGLNWTRLRSTMAGEAAADVAHAADNCQHGSLMCYDLWSSCWHSCSASWIWLSTICNCQVWQFAINCGFGTWVLHFVPLIKIFRPRRTCSAFCPLCSWRTRQTCQQRRLGSICGFLSPKAVLNLFCFSYL